MRNCPICHSTAEQSAPFLQENIDSSKLSDFSFASRKEPEYMCYQLVRCLSCDLVYANEPPDQQQLALAYHQADYDSSQEAEDAATAYITAMQPILAKLQQKQSVLEIGSGTGVLLELLQQQGFSQLVGIEPSAAAIAAAPQHRQAWLKLGIFNEADFEPESFDLICCFMTLEHVSDPMATTVAAFRLLKRGGVFIVVTHDYRSVVNRLLGKRSPIIDIEHLQLFSKTSIHELFKRTGFTELSSQPFSNRYAVNYWLRLMPLPKVIKSAVQKFLLCSKLGKVKLSFNVGNRISAGFKA